MKILFIGARLFDDVAAYATKKGVTSILTESDPSSPNIKLADNYYHVSRGMEEPSNIALKEDVDAVVPLIGVDKPLVEIAQMKDHLEKNYGIPVVASPLNAAKTSVNKSATKKFFSDNNIETPMFEELSIKDSLIKNNLDKMFDNLDFEFPFVLKPFEGQGGSGLKIIHSKNHFFKYFENNNTAIAEQFIEGIEISVEVLRWQEQAIPLVPVNKGKTTIEGLHPLDKIKKAPASIEGMDNDLVCALALEVTNLLGAEGNTDVDMIFDPEKFNLYVIEMNTRPSGTRYITTASCDINPMHELVEMALGEWDKNIIKDRMKNYYAMEVPIKNYDKFNKISSDLIGNKDFSSGSSWILHGPPAFKRITIRDKNPKKAIETMKKLEEDFEKGIGMGS
ncbi:MAG: ATP-grasp domain-containing protein [Methanomicrobiales archaeon]